MSFTEMDNDTLELARRLIACRSVTPEDAGCLDILAARLAPLGFRCERMDSNGVSNLWARRGTAAPLLVLAGHADVVPTGPLEHWQSDPFTPTIRDGVLYGRGASDMKSSLAAFTTAIERFVAAHPDHAGLRQHLQVFRDRGLAHGEGSGQLVDRRLARRQQR